MRTLPLVAGYLDEQMEKARKDSNGDRDKMQKEMGEFREKMQKSREDQQKKFEDILSEASRLREKGELQMLSMHDAALAYV